MSKFLSGISPFFCSVTVRDGRFVGILLGTRPLRPFPPSKGLQVANEADLGSSRDIWRRLGVLAPTDRCLLDVDSNDSGVVAEGRRSDMDEAHTIMPSAMSVMTSITGWF